MTRFKKLRALVAVASMSAAFGAFAADIDMNANANDVAISGYDPVGYFSDSEATKGSEEYTATYKNAIYHFSSAENRDLFRAAPSSYAPQYGGYCAFGVTMEKKFDVDPEAWRIVDNKLYLNLNKDVQKRWLTDVPGYIANANDIWPDIKTVEASAL
ncbi:MAG: YHS domain-containing (seleno)protein [Pseudoruegeria sp.]